MEGAKDQKRLSIYISVTIGHLISTSYLCFALHTSNSVDSSFNFLSSFEEYVLLELEMAEDLFFKVLYRT